MYKAIIFDFFGVINADPYNKWLAEHGYQREGAFAENSDTVDLGKITEQEFFGRLSKLSGQSVASISKVFFDAQFNTELVQLIEKLKTSYKIGLLSNSRGDFLRPLLEQGGIANLFDDVIVSSEVGIIKPDPRIFEITLQRFNVAPEETVFVDDRAVNVDTAESLGIQSILYTDLPSLKTELVKLQVFKPH